MLHLVGIYVYAMFNLYHTPIVITGMFPTNMMLLRSHQLPQKSKDELKSILDEKSTLSEEQSSSSLEEQMPSTQNDRDGENSTDSTTQIEAWTCEECGRSTPCKTCVRHARVSILKQFSNY